MIVFVASILVNVFVNKSHEEIYELQLWKKYTELRCQMQPEITKKLLYINSEYKLEGK